jgi:N-acetylmuramoyl-L-alanine amidase
VRAAVVLAVCATGAVACGGAASSQSAAGPAEAGSRGQVASAASSSGRSSGSEAFASGTSAKSSAAHAGRAVAKVLAGKTIVIDPGHNGGDFRHPEIVNRQVNVLTKWKPCDTTGTSTSDGYTEAAFNWDVSNRLMKVLRAEGATVKLTRHDNTGVGPCITERAAIGNRAKADAAISIHADGAAAANHGFHIIMPKKINGPVDPVVGDSKRLGLAVRDAYRAGTGVAYSTYIGSQALDYRTDLGGLNLSTVPKVFIECGNMRNAAEAAKFKDSAFRQRIAESIAKGMQNYLT